MKRLFRWGYRTVLVFLLLLVLFILYSVYFKPVHIRIFFERVFAEYAFNDPQLLSSLRILPPWLDWYGVGMNTLVRLREEAKTELGPQFNISRFHDEVLTGGDMPMALLEQRVHDWTARERKR